MRNLGTLSSLLRALLFLFSLTLVGQIVLAQTPAIEPCQSPPAGTTATEASKTAGSPTKVGVNVTETLVDSNVADDAAVENVLSPYAAKVRALNVVIGNLQGELRTGGVGANTMGNFVADAMRATALERSNKPVVLTITNAGGLRKSSIAPGEMRAADIFELLPFENALIRLDITGAQLLDLLKRVTTAGDAQSGAVVQFRWNDQNRRELLSARMMDKAGREREIDPLATYSIVTIDYLLKLRGGNYAILQEGMNVTPLNLTIREAVMNYVKAATAGGRKIEARLDQRFVQVGPSPIKSQNPRND